MYEKSKMTVTNCVPKIEGTAHPKIFGVGIMKTGTKTLAEVLRRLGYDHCSYNKECLLLLLEGERTALTKIFYHYDSFDDWPWPRLYREAHAMFPDAKFILTVRKSEDAWYNSLLKHYDRGQKNLLASQKNIYKGLFGYESPHENKDAFIKAYIDHNNAVREYFKDQPNRMLEVCWEQGDGWGEICKFLDADLPQTTLPHKNRGGIKKPQISPSSTRKLLQKLKISRRAIGKDK